MTSFVNRHEPKTIILRIQFNSIRFNRICVTYDMAIENSQSFAPKGVQLSLVRPTNACFGWIPLNCWIFHHSSSFLITLGPYSSAFVSFLSYCWLFNVATSFVNGPLASLSSSSSSPGAGRRRSCSQWMRARRPSPPRPPARAASSAGLTRSANRGEYLSSPDCLSQHGLHFNGMCSKCKLGISR